MYDQSQIAGNLKAARGIGVKTRSCTKKLLKLKKTNTERFKRSLTYLGPKLWNALPGDLQFVQSRSEFKTNIITHVAAKALALNA